MGHSKRILLGVTHFQSTGFYRNFTQILFNAGSDKVFVVSNPRDENQSADHLAGSELKEIQMSREINPVRDFIALFEWIGLLRKIRPEVIAVGTPKAGMLGIIAGWLTRVPKRIYVVRGLRLETEKGFKKSILLMIERLVARLSTSVQYVSPSLRQRCLQLGIGTLEKAVVIDKGSSNGIDLDRFNPEAFDVSAIEHLQAEFGLNPNLTTIGFVGRLVADKGLKDLIAAVEIIARDTNALQLLLIGGEDSNQGSFDTTQLTELGITVVKTGAVEDVRPFYQMMDVFVLPTLREGFPNVVLEARAMRSLVVTTDATGAIDSIGSGEFGILAKAGDSRDLARGIREALGLSPQEREELLDKSEKDLQHYERSMLQKKIAEYYLS